MSNMSRFLLALLFVLASTLAAEVPVAPLDLGPVPREQRNPAVAPFGSGGWLAVWEDARETYGDVAYATRISETGEVLDPAGIRVPLPYGSPNVACAADRCLVIDRAFFAALVDRDGKVRSLGRFAGEYASFLPQLFFNGRDFVLFWTPTDTPRYGVRALTIDLEGKAQGAPVDVLPGESEPVLRSAAFNGSRFGVLYQVDESLRFAVTSATGAPIAGGVTIDDGGSLGVADVAAADDGFVAVWGEWSVNDISAVRIAGDGTIQGAPILLGAGSAMSPRLVPAGDGYVLYHLVDDGAPVELVRRTLSPGLALGPAVPVPMPDGGVLSSFAAAEGSSEPLVVTSVRFTDSGFDESEVFASGGAIGNVPKPLTSSASSQHAPAIAAGTRETLVAWEARRGGGVAPRSELQLALIDRRSGVARQFTLETSAPYARPKAAAVGDAFLVIWKDGTALRGRMVRDGQPAGAAFTIAADAGDAAVSATRGAFLVGWAQTNPKSIGMARVFLDGTVVRRPEPVPVLASDYTHEPALACADDRCLLVWRTIQFRGVCPRGPCTVESRVFGQRFDAWMAALDAQPISSAATARSPTPCSPPRPMTARSPSGGRARPRSPSASSTPPATSVRPPRGRASAPSSRARKTRGSSCATSPTSPSASWCCCASRATGQASTTTSSATGNPVRRRPSRSMVRTSFSRTNALLAASPRAACRVCTSRRSSHRLRKFAPFGSLG